MAAISLRRLQQISPSGGGRRVPPPLPPQKIIGKLERPLFCRYRVVYKKTEMRRPLRAKRTWVARPARVSAQPGLV
jgi:hypothetical protein